MEMGMQKKEALAGDAEGVNILEAIPPRNFPNIWKMIVSDAATLTGLLNAISTDDAELKRILDPKRKLWLFSQVFPLLTRFLSMQDVLILRQVGRAWSQSVDEFIGNPDNPSPYESFGLMKKVRIENPIRDTLPYLLGGVMPELNVPSFLETMRDHPRNPFVGRHVEIYQSNWLVPIAQIQDQIDRFLPVFGHHLSFVMLYTFGDMTVLEFGTMLRQILSNTPNLKHFFLRTGWSHIGEGAEDEIPVIQLPVMTHLRTVQLEYNGEPNTPPTGKFNLVMELLRIHSTQLTRFDVKGLSPLYWTLLDWPNLKELRVNKDPWDGRPLSCLLQVDAPQLVDLHLIIYEGHHNLEEFTRLKQRFPKLEHFGMTARNINDYYF